MTTQPIGVTFSEELQKQMFGDNTVSHPIDFDDVWKWVDYSRKDHAVRALLAELDTPLDYVLVAPANLPRKGESPDLKGSGPHKYFLTVDGFKAFCLAAGTNKGKQVRRYFIELEKRYKDLAAEAAVKSVFQDGPQQVNINVSASGGSTSVKRRGLNKELQAIRCEITQTISMLPTYGAERVAEIIAAQMEELDYVTKHGVYEDRKDASTASKKTAPPAPPAPVKPPDASKRSTELMQSQNGRVGAVTYKGTPVYVVPALPDSEKIATVRYNTHAGRRRTPDVHVYSVFVIEAALDALLAAFTRTDVYIAGDSLATGCFTAAVIAELGVARANRLLGRRIKAAGWQRVSTYRTASSGTAVIYEFVGGADA